ncbi:MAG TPA: hypothetical protein DDW49_08540 [Deltaproteobacteria bacterium]|nr:MAG: hypothetical protein A2048_05500 [Deltaproteobacteria bacterium GWA2_45_12]HBF13412.1 hypothetical protein [Deltaproteobacteria bacterium]
MYLFIRAFLVGITCFFFSFKTHAYYPATLWSSDRISETLVGVRVGPVLKDEKPALVTLSPHHLVIYEKNEEKISKLIEYNNLPDNEWIKLGLYDFEGDGVEEILIAGFRKGRPLSVVLQVENKQIIQKAEAPFFVNVIEWEGKKQAVGQNSLGLDDFTGPVFKLELKGKALQKGEIFFLPGGLSGKAIPLFSLQGFFSKEISSDGFLYLNDLGNLVHFGKKVDTSQKTKWKTKWTSSPSYGGAVYFLKRVVANPFGQVENQRFYVPVSFESNSSFWSLKSPVDSQGLENALCPEPVSPEPVLVYGVCVSPKKLPRKNLNEPVKGDPWKLYLIKNEGYLKNVIGAVPSVKNSQMVRVLWTGYGFQEEWNSPRLDGAISDFTLVDWDGDGREEILAAFLLRDKGYTDTLKKQDSLLLVIQPK